MYVISFSVNRYEGMFCSTMRYKVPLSTCGGIVVLALVKSRSKLLREYDCGNDTVLVYSCVPVDPSPFTDETLIMQVPPLPRPLSVKIFRLPVHCESILKVIEVPAWAVNPAVSGPLYDEGV